MLTIMNPDDKAGLEAALRLKEQYGAEVTVLTMGLPKADEVLREAMAMGADLRQQLSLPDGRCCHGPHPDLRHEGRQADGGSG